MFEKVKAILKSSQPKQKAAVHDRPSQGMRNISAYSMGYTLACLENGSYDNNYPNITRIAEQAMTVFPYAVDQRGERLREQPAAVRALYAPNRQMSAVKFLKSLFVMALVHPTVYILPCTPDENGVATPGGDIRPDNIAGYVFLEDPTVSIQDGHYVYEKGTRTYTDREVIRISLDVNPYGLLAGYSPSVATKKWANIDDYIADQQAGYFKNGARPSGLFTITAPDSDTYNRIVDRIIEEHQGSGKNDNVFFAHRPTDPIDGKAAPAQIEWTEFKHSNKDLAMKDVFDQSMKVRDMVFGVPAEIKGYVSNSNYASVTTARYIFDKYVVEPKLIQMWSDFTNELNRITGGLGYALSFDYEVAPLEDENKVHAEVTQIQLNTLATAMQGGFELKSAIEALDLPASFAKLNLKAPDMATDETIIPEEPTASQLEASVIKNAQSHGIKRKDLQDNIYNAEIPQDAVKAIQQHMAEQIQDAIDDKGYKEDKDRARRLAEALLLTLVPVILASGTEQHEAGLALLAAAGKAISGLKDFAVTEATRNSYLDYLKRVSLDYDTDTADAIKRVLEQAASEGWDKETSATQLRSIMNTDEWRVQRLARTETHHAQGIGKLDAMRELQDETGVAITKTWHVNPATVDHCEDCLALNGVTLPLNTPFVRLGAELPATGRLNDFEPVQAAAAHPNCGCYLTFAIEEGIEPDNSPEVESVISRSAKVICPKCKHYLFEGKDGEVENVKCQRCKKRYDVTIKKGQVNIKEKKVNEQYSKS